MIINNNNPSRSFANQHRSSINNQNNTNNQLNNSFENKWNKIKEYNENRPQSKNIFVKDIKEQHYADSSNTNQMQDRTLALLNERLNQGTISLEEFNKRCADLGKQRLASQKNNKLF